MPRILLPAGRRGVPSGTGRDASTRALLYGLQPYSGKRVPVALAEQAGKQQQRAWYRGDLHGACVGGILGRVSNHNALP